MFVRTTGVVADIIVADYTCTFRDYIESLQRSKPLQAVSAYLSLLYHFVSNTQQHNCKGTLKHDMITPGLPSAIML